MSKEVYLSVSVMGDLGSFSADMSRAMVGWGNRFPIGQTQEIALGESGSCLGQGWKNVYPVAWASAGS